MPKIYKVDKKKLDLNGSSNTYTNINFDTKLDINTANIFVCEPCYKYINLNKLKNLLRISKSASQGHQNYITNNTNTSTNTCTNTYKKQLSYTKCNICNRLIANITAGSDIIKFLNKFLIQTSSNNIVSDELLLQIAKYSKWQYNDIYDYFNADLVKKFKISRKDYLNINQAINDLEGLPAINIINERSEDLYNYLTKEIDSNARH